MNQVQDSDQLYERASTLVDLDRMGEAILLLTRLLERDPEHVYALCCMALVWDKQKNSQEALLYADRAVHADPDEEWGHRLRSSILQSLERHDEALAAAREALRLEPDYPPCMIQLSSVLRDCNRLEEAEQAAERLIEIAPDSASSHIEMALVYSQQKRYRQAADSNRKALSLNPESSVALNNLGLALKYLGQNEEALGYYGLALQFNPNNCIAHNNLIHQAEQCGYTSLDEYLMARGNPEQAQLLIQRNKLKEHAEALLQSQPWQALANLHQAVALTPYDLSLYLSLSEAHICCGNLNEALRAADYTLRVKLDYWQGHLQRCFVLWKMSEHPSWAVHTFALQQDAVNAAIAAIHASNENRRCIEYLCTVLSAFRRYSEAEQAAWRLIELAPTWWRAYHVMGSIQGEQRRWYEAEQCFRKGVECEPRCAEALYDVGVALVHQGKKTEARWYYLRAHELEPDNATYRQSAKGFWNLLNHILSQKGGNPNG
ncbi:MAG TPA: tetratricopeptide repeat protein [Chthonomonadaceae bacterium]|nr:tetratricopeptide repeat protein [Chthonomonadaceae bacterium]